MTAEVEVVLVTGGVIGVVAAMVYRVGEGLIVIIRATALFRMNPVSSETVHKRSLRSLTKERLISERLQA